MQKINDLIFYSASDIVNFLTCEHMTTLDRMNLETPLPKAEDDEGALLLQSKGIEHEKTYLEHLKHHVSNCVEISSEYAEPDLAFKKTIEAMEGGADIIYQATLMDGSLVGHADFLRRVPLPSALGNYSYEAVDTKLSRSAKTRYIVQLCFYSGLLTSIQKRDPLMMHLVFGDRREEGFRYADYSRYFNSLKERFLRSVQAAANETYPETGEGCDFCRWRELCKERWLEDDHLNQVANMSRVQIKKFRECGIDTLEKLAVTKETSKIPGMAKETFIRLRRLAAIQLKKRKSGNNQYELLPIDPEGKRGFARLPKPDPGDMFFDMEGDPLEEGGLEYLFGLYYFEQGKPVFKPIWGRTRADEKAAFEDFMDFVTDRLRQYPKAHIYHYASYEESALKKLMSLYGVRESEVDNLLRLGKLVDLYKVVREGIRISEPRYSLKNVEHFYLEERTGDVKDAGASVVYYEKWKETGDEEFLTKIADYNHDDVRSTYGLREWLLQIRPEHLPWLDHFSDGTNKPGDVTALNEWEERLAKYGVRLLENLPENRDEWNPEHYLRELTYQLLDFHRRAAKPVWWALFSRSEMSEEELIEDVEAIGGMIQDSRKPPYPDKRSMVYTYRYPEQETKLKTGDSCVVADTLEPVNDVVIDEENRVVTLRYAVKRGLLPLRLNIGLGGPISTNPLTEALFDFADSIIEEDHKYEALEAVLYHRLPDIDGLPQGSALIDEEIETIPQVAEVVSRLDQSYLFLQGPPGSGKTFTGSHIVVELLRRGFRVGVSSNSHKAINNLLAAIENVAVEKGIRFRGVKKSTSGDDTAFGGSIIIDVCNNDDVMCGNWQLVAGTAWLFSVMEQQLDFLFVEEAGQVALANLVAMGTSATNVVLLGDQMQLSQPIQGIHPGRSGESSLDYLLNGLATIPQEQGIFLGTTWRMHENVCNFISDAVYDGRLRPFAENNNRCLILGADAHRDLRPSGIRFIPIEHEGCSQRSQEEADLIREMFESLLRQHYRDKDGIEHPLTKENVLVVAPYNMQVNLLKRTLPKDARVGTVDKFQGQEAEVVIISMTTSNGELLPRNMEFLYSKNRLNVALSRAKSLALLVANPDLTTIRCRTVEQMALVNTLCWVKEYSEAGI